MKIPVMKITKNIGLVAVFLSFSVTATGQSNILMEENRGQWPSEVLFKTDIPGATVFLERDQITYALYDNIRLEEIHHEAHEKFNDPSWQENDQLINCHSLKLKLINANFQCQVTAEDRSDAFVNYFIGNDYSKWASNVPLFKSLKYKNIYNKVDLHFLGSGNNFKYEFYVEPGGDPYQIILNYTGAEGILLNEGNLHIKTSISDLIEQKPVAWQISGNQKKFVACEFKLTNGFVSFNFPQGFDKDLPLVIDPVVIASTFSGSTATTYGHSATYDLSGNIYSGGRAFSTGYPITAGAFQVSFGGSVDIAITKYNPTASSRIYSTYLGGSSGDYVHSMFVDSTTNQLVIYGSSSSSDYPTTPGAYDATYNGVTDIVLTRVNSTGTALIGSTYVGGSSGDGNNAIPKNYGDTYRGEVVLDPAGNIYVTSFSSSNNFPVTAGAYDVSYNGLQDGVVICLNQNLTSLLWSTFIGGSGDDAAFGIKVDSFGDVYVVGCTSSSNFPMVATSYQSSLQGGIYDGFVCKFSSNGSMMPFSTYYGTSSYDGIFFIDLDENNNIFTYGITDGVIPITPGKYGNPGSRQFITKFDPFLSSVVWQTTFGNGSSGISPTAFLVDICNRIYAAGWGQTSGYPITVDAVQSSPGSFYVIVLEIDANSLLHGTYYGVSGDHVDGGTSRFDKNGIVYEGVCTNSSSFPTTPGVVSSTINSSWDIAVFKIEFQLSAVSALAVANPTSGCSPLTVNFTNQSSNGFNYFWNFGDGTTSTLENPTHTFLNPGMYQVMFVVQNPNSCNIADTMYIPINVLNTIQVSLGPDTVLCTGNSLTLNAGNPGATYLWSNNQTSQTISVSASGGYMVTVTQNGCIHSDTINVQFTPTPVVNLGNDTTVCGSVNIQLSAGNTGLNYFWSTNETTQNINVNSPGTYWVQVGPSGCAGFDTIVVNSISAPIVNLGLDVTLCDQSSYLLNVSTAGLNYFWSTGATTQSITVNNSGNVWVQVNNGFCSTYDTINVTMLTSPVVNLGPDTTLCNQFSFPLNAGNSGQSYLWSTNSTSQTININSAGMYWVAVGPAGCPGYDTITVNSVTAPVVNLGNDLNLCDQSSQILDAGNPGLNYLWSNNATTQTINVTGSGVYYVEVSNGFCNDADTINVNFLSSPLVNLGVDTTLCNPFTLTLNAANPGQNYLWSTNATTQTININSAGIYWVQVGPAGCYGYDTINVISVSVPSVNLGTDLNLCDQGSQILDAGNPGLNYLWSNSATTQTISVSNSGIYFVEVNNGYCSNTDSIAINFYTSPVVNLGPDLTFCSNSTATLDAGNPGSIYQWSDGSTTQTINVNSSGIFWVTVGPGVCNSTDTVVVQVEQAPVVELGNDTILCDVDSFLLDAGYGPGYSYTWAPGGLTTQTITVDQTFIYNVIVTSPNGCTVVDNITIYFLETPSISLGPDITDCGNMLFTLDAGNPGNIYQWSTGDTSQTIQVQNSGNYWVVVGYAGCSASDTISINLIPFPEPSLGPDTILCDGQEIILTTGLSGIHQWSTGHFTNSITVNSAGTYIVTVTDQICSGTDTLNILFEPMPQFVLDDHLPCVGDSVILDAQNAGFNYLWSTGDSSQYVTVTNSGIYSVQIYNSRCSITDSSNVEYVIIETKEEKINGCDKIEVVLDAGNPGSNYNWSEGQFNQQIIVRDTGNYWVMIEKNGCRDTSTFKIEKIVGTSNIYLPNAFTPNDDGINEIYNAVAYGIESFDLKIFNRWGELVFFTDNPEKGWDGTFENKPLKQDLYIYKVEYHSMCNSKEKVEKIGKLMLLK